MIHEDVIYKSRSNREQDIRNKCRAQYEIEGSPFYPDVLTLQEKVWWGREVSLISSERRKDRLIQDGLDAMSQIVGIEI